MLAGFGVVTSVVFANPKTTIHDVINWHPTLAARGPPQQRLARFRDDDGPPVRFRAPHRPAPSPQVLALAQRYAVGDFVDVRSADGKWHASQVCGFSISRHFQGFTPRCANIQVLPHIRMHVFMCMCFCLT